MRHNVDVLSVSVKGVTIDETLLPSCVVKFASPTPCPVEHRALVAGRKRTRQNSVDKCVFTDEIPIDFFADCTDLDTSGGSSTVAIDNKIEQAMDLVKSHLMFAVREEVDVLKEQIKELLEKNQQLEQENNVLKAAAPPEVLQKLSSQTQTQTQPPTSSS